MRRKDRLGRDAEMKKGVRMERKDDVGRSTEVHHASLVINIADSAPSSTATTTLNRFGSMSLPPLGSFRRLRNLPHFGSNETNAWLSDVYLH